MVETIQDSFEISIKNISVEDFFKSEKNFPLIKDFLEGRGPAKVIIYFQQETPGQEYDMRDVGSEPHLFLTSGENDKLNNKGVYFLRMVEGRGVNLNDLDSDVLFGEITQDTLKQINSMISNVFLPMVKNMDKKDWRECDEEQKKEFVSVTNKFSDELEEGIRSLSDSIDTCKIDQGRLTGCQNEFEKSSYFES